MSTRFSVLNYWEILNTYVENHSVLSMKRSNDNNFSVTES